MKRFRIVCGLMSLGMMVGCLEGPRAVLPGQGYVPNFPSPVAVADAVAEDVSYEVDQLTKQLQVEATPSPNSPPSLISEVMASTQYRTTISKPHVRPRRIRSNEVIAHANAVRAKSKTTNASDTKPIEKIEPKFEPIQLATNELATNEEAREPAVLGGTPTSTPTESLVLTPDACRQRAVLYSAKAGMLDLERELSATLADCESCRAAIAMELLHDILLLRAEDQSNSAAAEALSTYYQLANIAAQRAIMQTSLSEASDATKRIDRLYKQGLLQGGDRYGATQKQFELLQKDSELLLLEKQLTAKLHALLGVPETTTIVISEAAKPSPSQDWIPQKQSFVLESEIALGLQIRRDVRIVRLVASQLSVESMPIARAVLQSVDGSLGTATKPKKCFPSFRCRNFDCEELTVRSEQIGWMEETQASTAEAEIRAAIAQSESAQQQAVLAQLSASVDQRELAELEKKRDLEGSSWSAISQKKLASLASESAFASKMTALRLAKVELYRAQGRLAETYVD